MAGRASRISVRFIEDTNHSFADLRGRLAILDNLDQWVGSNFPLASRQGAELPSERRANQNAYLTASPR
jgi:hypothetical protein